MCRICRSRLCCENGTCGPAQGCYNKCGYRGCTRTNSGYPDKVPGDDDNDDDDDDDDYRSKSFKTSPTLNNNNRAINEVSILNTRIKTKQMLPSRHDTLSGCLITKLKSTTNISLNIFSMVINLSNNIINSHRVSS
ncbi:hypothetical protein LSH36_547g01011 [Paralvinella palmiformis]|uniref:Uncharacterized protein n=1 Tax=Paralvinella palmiformis TaxID=53620 RepID=A0AAD9J723_9ANNE|nr:hypothetical protein LSH36_547g01011 [Paralvinella palmiformis]